MGGFEQAGPAEAIEEFSLVGIISSELLPPRFNVHTVLDGALDFVESRPRIRADARDLLVHGFHHGFDKPGFLLDKGFALEHASMAGNERLEVQLHHPLQRGDLLDRETASEIRYRSVHQITGDQDFLFRQVGNSIANGVAASQEFQLDVAVSQVNVEVAIESDVWKLDLQIAKLRRY